MQAHKTPQQAFDFWALNLSLNLIAKFELNEDVAIQMSLDLLEYALSLMSQIIHGIKVDCGAFECHG